MRTGRRSARVAHARGHRRASHRGGELRFRARRGTSRDRSPAHRAARMAGGAQGVGDVLFFMRFVPLLRARGVTVSLACEKKLVSILEDAREYRGEEAMPIGDLPLVLDTEETPPAWPLAVREKASLERFGP